MAELQVEKLFCGSYEVIRVTNNLGKSKNLEFLNQYLLNSLNSVSFSRRGITCFVVRCKWWMVKAYKGPSTVLGLLVLNKY